MQALIDRIRTEGQHVGGGIVKLDSFLNHQIDPMLISAMGREFVERFSAMDPSTLTKVITAEVSGIPPAFATADRLGVSMIYARKHRSAVMTDVYFGANARSRTKNEEVNLMISRSYLTSSDRVLIIDDFLATGSTVNALSELVSASGAVLAGIGCVIEKPAERGRDRLAGWRVPIEALARVTVRGDALVVTK